MESICPYLGLIDDPNTSTVFPANCNACQRTDPPKPVVLHHQRDYCLTDKHTDCEGFTSGWPQGFPRSLRNKRCRKQRSFLRSSQGKLSAAGIIGVGLLVLLLIAGVYFAISYLQPASVATPQDEFSAADSMATETHLALAAMLTPSVTPPETATSTPTAEPTSTPTPDFTPTQTPGPGLRTPFGSQDLLLLVHEVQEQETITGIANQYNTTVDVLWILNGLAYRTLWVGDPVIVSLGRTDMQGLPRLQAFYLEPGTTLSDLADKNNAAISDLREWNGLGEADWIAGARWVVVPFD